MPLLPRHSMRVCVLGGPSCVQPSVTPQTAAHQAPLSMGFSRQEYWSGVPLPSPDSKSSLCISRSTVPVKTVGRQGPRRVSEMSRDSCGGGPLGATPQQQRTLCPTGDVCSTA